MNLNSRFTLVSRSILGLIMITFAASYLFENTILALSGSVLLLYLAYRRMEFHSLVKRVSIDVEKKVLEDVVHKDSSCSVRLTVSARESVSVTLTEQLHRTFLLESDTRTFHGVVSKDRPLVFTYSMIPKERGYFRYPPLKITIKEGRDLFETDMKVDPGLEVFVRASKKEIALARLMARKRQFEITGPAHKRHTRTYRSDFRSVRDYIPGDRFRDIDWKAMSRLTKLMTKEFEQETNLPTMIMVDSSLSMRELVKSRSKIDHAIALALQMAIVLSSNHHPVGLITFDENKVMEHLSPGKCDLDDVVMSLFKLPNPAPTGEYPGIPRFQYEDTGDEDSNMLSKIGPFLVRGHRNRFSRIRTSGIFEAMRSMEKAEETGMMVVIISDIETNRPSFLRAVQRILRRKHRVVLVSPPVWTYHLVKDELTVEMLERMYDDRLEKQTLLKGLASGGVRIIDIDSRERGEKVLSNIRRMSQ